jgi:hypothetical protein
MKYNYEMHQKFHENGFYLLADTVLFDVLDTNPEDE